MAKVVIEKPEIVTISYRQTKDDKDYGSCLWARFNFDTQRYTLHIDSDCGNFSNGWYPTPNSETFMELCSRFEGGYLLDKISARSRVNGDATFKSLMEWLQEYDEYGYECMTKSQIRDIKDACHSNINDYAVLRAIQNALEDTAFDGSCSEYDIACCVEMDYPGGAKKVVEIFMEYIQPKCKEISGYKPTEVGNGG